jgi:hypothetical protein
MLSGVDKIYERITLKKSRSECIRRCRVESDVTVCEMHSDTMAGHLRKAPPPGQVALQ